MIVLTKNKQQLMLSKLCPDNFDCLTEYLQRLSTETKSKFGPHPFDKESVLKFYENENLHAGYIASEVETQKIIAYAIIKPGYLEHDSFRLQAYGLKLSAVTDCTFAPSVADAWQSQGVGESLFRFILKALHSTEIKRIILWGGVQSTNEKAVNFYKKHGFRKLGEFEYNGPNYDMIMEIP